MRLGVFYPTLNVYGGGEFVAAAVANALAKNNYDVTFFTNEPIDQRELKKFFGESLNSSIKTVVSPSSIQSRSLLGFYQTICRNRKRNLIGNRAYTSCRIFALKYNRDTRVPPSRKWTRNISGQQRSSEITDLPVSWRRKFAHNCGVYRSGA